MAAIGLFVVEAAALDWDSPAVGVPATIGVATAGLTMAYDFARPFIYKRSPKAVSVMDAVRVGVVPTADSAAGVTITYTLTGRSGR